jgi:hypothetical protein
LFIRFWDQCFSNFSEVLVSTVIASQSRSSSLPVASRSLAVVDAFVDAVKVIGTEIHDCVAYSVQAIRFGVSPSWRRSSDRMTPLPDEIGFF